jgi:hypothetical protein
LLQVLSSAARFAPFSDDPATLLEGQFSYCATFPCLLNDYLINNLVAQFVGKSPGWCKGTPRTPAPRFVVIKKPKPVPKTHRKRA